MVIVVIIVEFLFSPEEGYRTNSEASPEVVEKTVDVSQLTKLNVGNLKVGSIGNKDETAIRSLLADIYVSVSHWSLSLNEGTPCPGSCHARGLSISLQEGQ